MTIAKVRRPITSERSTDTVVATDPPTPRSFCYTPPPPYIGGGVSYSRNTNEPPPDTLAPASYVVRNIERAGDPGLAASYRHTADPPPDTLTPVSFVSREAERPGSPGSVQSFRMTMDPLPEGFKIVSTHVRESERPGHPGSVFYTFLPGDPPVTLPATLAPVACIAREADRPGSPGSAFWANTRFPDLPGPVAFRNINVARDTDRPGHPGSVAHLGFAPPEEPTPRVAAFAQSPFLRPPTGSVQSVGSASGGGTLAPTPRSWLVAIPVPTWVGNGGVLNPRTATDPPPPPVLPHAATVVSQAPPLAYRWTSPTIASRLASVSGEAIRPPTAVLVRTQENTGAIMGPSWTQYSQARTVSIEQLPRVIVAQEPWWPFAIRVPVQASAPMRFGLLVAPSIPDALFEAEPSAKLVDNFGRGGWPVFKARK